MQEKKKSYRERYFENYQAVRVPCSNRKGFRTVYEYVGLFARWTGDLKEVGKVKRDLFWMEAAGIVLSVGCTLSGTALTRARLFNGFGVLSLVPWLAELYGIARFLMSKEYVKEQSAEEIGNCIRIGTVLRALLTGLSVLAGGIQVIAGGSATPADLPVGMGVAAGGALSLLIRREFIGLRLEKYHNENGRPGRLA